MSFRQVQWNTVESVEIGEKWGIAENKGDTVKIKQEITQSITDKHKQETHWSRGTRADWESVNDKIKTGTKLHKAGVKTETHTHILI